MDKLAFFVKNSIVNHICGNYFNILKPTTSKTVCTICYKACTFKINLNKVAVEDGLITLEFVNITENGFKVFDFVPLEDKFIYIKNINPCLWNIYFSSYSLNRCSEFIDHHYKYLLETSEDNIEVLSKMNNLANKQGMLFKSVVD